ncbi:acyl-CoA dehydrogenase/oxidase [Mycena latifolia]|nr:acyl-CoA dehydrogenase/oxidase [Mycena latifolia]
MRPSETLCRQFQEELLRTTFDPRNRAPDDAYLRAEKIGRLHGLTLNDIKSLSPQFWNMHTDPILPLDGAATTLLTIQYNLVAGALGIFSDRDILQIADDIIKFKAIGQFCLTELDHGLDVFNLETTATLMDDGHFRLHTPHPGAAKFMPPTLPVLGRPCFAVVFARLMVNGASEGIRLFVVRLNDGFKMCPGISARILPPRGNSAPLNHCLTSFNCVNLPSSALLGELDGSGPTRLHFLSSIWRVVVGTLALTSVAIPCLEIASNIALRYSLRRIIRGNNGAMVPIFSFRTQQVPILTAIAQAFVFRALHQQAVKLFVAEALSPFVRHRVATAFKAVVIRDVMASHDALAARCGAQGSDCPQDEIRGIGIAEGDVLVLSIRLATELLLEKYCMPTSANPQSLLWLHEHGLLRKYRSIMASSGGHRSPKFASHVIPHCQEIVRALGYRMAYDAAVAADVPQSLIDIFVCNVLQGDLAWYIQNQLISAEDMQYSALELALPHAERWVAEMKVDTYVVAPIVSDGIWEDFCSHLQNMSRRVVTKL